MGLEIERKFLVKRENLPELAGGVSVRQGYLPTEGLITVRTRIKGDKGFLTLKGVSSEDGMSRSEFEYGIPFEDAKAMMTEFCSGRLVEKVRYEVFVEGHRWEIDVFGGANEGLILAEIEIKDVNEQIVLPDWIDKEVTGDVRFYNQRLAVSSWTEWAGADSSVMDR